MIEGTEWRFLRTNVDYYLLSLLVSDLILSIGSIMNIRWISKGGVEEGKFCAAQGAIQQIGDVGVALASLAIAVHTFAVLLLKWRSPQGRMLPISVIALIWLLLILITTIPSGLHHNSSYYGIAGSWCWVRVPTYIFIQYSCAWLMKIRSDLEKQGLLLDYAILWLAASINIVLYVPLFFCLRGNLQVSYATAPNQKAKPRMVIGWTRGDARHAWASEEGRKEGSAVARQMLAYPIAYSMYHILTFDRLILKMCGLAVLILPMSIVRWINRDGMSHVWIAVAAVIFCSSGFINVCLYIWTRPKLLPSWKLGHKKNPQGDVDVPALNDNDDVDEWLPR